MSKYTIYCWECDHCYKTDMQVSECPMCMAQNVILNDGENND